MENFFLRKEVRKFLNEFFNNQVVYSTGVNKFPYFDGTDEKTPSDLAAEFELDAENEEESESKSSKKSK